MIQLNAIYGGPAIGKTEKVNPVQVMVSLIDEMPDAKQDALVDAFYERLRDDEDYIKAALRYLAYNSLNNITNTQRRNGPGARKRQEAARTAAAEMTAQMVEKIKRAAVLDLLLPNGKTARESTFADCKKAGGMWLKIGAMGKPQEIVGQKITDKQANAIWRG